MPTVKERLKSILRSALVDAVMSTKDMTGVSLEERFQIWKALVQTSLIKELEKYDDCMGLKNLLVREVSASTASTSGVKKFFLKAA